MAIDLKGFDPWPKIGGSSTGSATAEPVGMALSMISGDWLSTGLQVLGGLFGGSDTEVSQAAAAGQSGINTSGWAVGEGTAQGADLTQSLSMQSMENWPWYYWAAGTLVAVVIIKKAV